MTKKDDSYPARAREAPRLTGLFETFGKLAEGTAGQPDLATVEGQHELLGDDALGLQMLDTYISLAGVFAEHAIASMPYVLEEDCRMAAALLRYAHSHDKSPADPLNAWMMGAAEGCMARTLATVAQGTVQTLSCSPNPENERQFFTCGAPPQSYFFTGPFFDVTPRLLRSSLYRPLADGLDVIVEDTTFQMYGPDRRDQISCARANLKEGGVFVFFEKMTHDDPTEYARRERQKDDQFKARFFSAHEIDTKRTTVLSTMETGQVTLADLTAVLRDQFAHAVVTWNSGNFYTVAASDDAGRLQALVAAMTEPAIPPEFVNVGLPQRLLGNGHYAFGRAQPTTV